MNKYCVSLNTAKALKQAGFPQENSSRYYCGGHTMYFEDQENGKFEDCENTDLLQEDEYCHTAGLVCDFFLAAPTADEILDLLPEYVLDDKRDMAGLKCGKWNKKYWTEYHCTFNSLVKRIESESLADALAEMWLYLKEPKNIVECQKHKNK